MTDARCNRCGGEFEPDDTGIVPMLRCKICERTIPAGALRHVDGEQLRILPGLTPAQVMEEAAQLGPFVARVCLFSGGHDSCVLAHRCRDYYDELAFIDTGTAVPGVREFVEEYAAWIDKPLRILEAGDAWRLMVLGGGERPRDGKPHVALGFPGPGQHGRAYTRLKERQLEQLKRDLKEGHPRNSRVLFLTGVRRAESARRAKRMPVTRVGGTVFCNPLIDWTAFDMRRYRTEHELPESDVSALIHRSGECNCGAYAQPGEREMLRDLWPNWFDRTIGSLEREAKARGIAHCEWGAGRDGDTAEPGGPLCASCDYRQMQMEDAA